jgi:hypothetical protein
MSTPDPVEIGQSSYSTFEPVHQCPQQSNNTTTAHPTAFPHIVLLDNQLTGQNVPQYRNMLCPRSTDFQGPADQHARPVIDRRTSQDGLPMVSTFLITNIYGSTYRHKLTFKYNCQFRPQALFMPREKGFSLLLHQE